MIRVPRSLPDRYSFLIRFTLGIVLITCACIFAVFTFHWPLIGDATLMHYIVFLIQHGMRPYRDIADMNMPGTYLLERAVMSTFGGGSLAWRLFDLILIATATGTMMVIARPYDWFAGLFSGVIFALIHGSDGIPDMGQRDLSIAVLLLLAYAFLFHALRRNQPWATAISGFCAGMAATLKPTVAPLGILLLFMAVGALRKEKKPLAAHFWLGAAGLAIPLLLTFAFLLQEHAVHAFLWTLFHLVPYDASLARRSIRYLLQHCLSPIQPLAAIWLILALTNRFWKNWEYLALIAGACFGLISYVVQGKGYPYHRYTLVAFMLLLAGIECTAALRRRYEFVLLGLSGLVFGSLVLAPIALRQSLHYEWWRDDFQALLRSDLNTLGGSQLSGHVQCIDMSAGCIKTLYHMRLVQATGFLYQYYLLASQQNSITARERNRFWHAIQANPPAVVIVTDQDYLVANAGFHKLDRWPLFEKYLERNYTTYAERTPTHPVKWEPKAAPPPSYRIYLRKR